VAAPTLSSCYTGYFESGVLGRLAKLTSATAANLGRPMHQLYPEHAKALQRAGLSSSRLPTLRQVLDCRSGSQGRSRSRSATKISSGVFLSWFLQNFGLRQFKPNNGRVRLDESGTTERTVSSPDVSLPNVIYRPFPNLRWLIQFHISNPLVKAENHYIT
jgi:hypothetical protein